MELYKLRYFLGVARRENLQLASKDLSASPSALSKAVASLEEGLDTKLFRKKGRNLALTDSGRHLQKRAAALLDFELTIRQEFTDKNLGLEMHFAGREFLLGYFGLDTVKKFEKEVFISKVGFHGCSGAEALAAVEGGSADFSITIQKPNRRMKSLAIGSFSQQVVAAPTHPLFKKKHAATSFNIKDILPYDFASPDRRNISTATEPFQSIDGWPERGTPRTIKYQVESVELLGALVASGRALAYVPEFWAKERGFKIIKIKEIAGLKTHNVYLSARKSESVSWCQKLIEKLAL